MVASNQQLSDDQTEQCRFVHPFPASRLSSDELLHALSSWLTPSPPISHWLSLSPTTVPMVFSHNEWFVQCVPVLRVLIDQSSPNRGEEETDEHPQQRHEKECRVQLLLHHLHALTVRTPTLGRRRDEMRLFIDTFGTLLRCSAQPSDESTKRLAQRALVVLLDRFEPVAQFLLLSRLFHLLVQRKLPLSDEAYEPQLMAWLVDIYRTKCYAKTDEAEATTTTAVENGAENDATEVGELFRAQLGHFYAQIEDTVFEDPLAAVNFYVSICLLLVSQALHRHRPTLLRQMGPSWLSRIREQVRDWRALNETNKAAQQQQQRWQNEQKRNEYGGTEMQNAIRLQMAQTEEQQQSYRLNMLVFQLDEAEQRVDEALNALGNEKNHA